MDDKQEQETSRVNLPKTVPTPNSTADATETTMTTLERNTYYSACILNIYSLEGNLIKNRMNSLVKKFRRIPN
jgi:hypothetical protein